MVLTSTTYGWPNTGTGYCTITDTSLEWVFNLLDPGVVTWKVVQHHFFALETPMSHPFPVPGSLLLFFGKKKCIFKPSVCRSWDTNFSRNLFQTPQFQIKQSVPETLLLKTLQHIPTQIFFEYPLGSSNLTQTHTHKH